MKYIRTKDGIFRIDNDKISFIDGCQFVSILGGIFHALNIKDKVADTIEELCDEFVAVSKDNKYRSLVKIEETGNRWVEDKITQWCEILKNKLVNWDIYGAIWTDKGLIYVAKMNEKGELCLI